MMTKSSFLGGELFHLKIRSTLQPGILIKYWSWHKVVGDISFHASLHIYFYVPT